MPIYEYDCFSCNQTLEAIQKVDEKPLVSCPRCGATGMKKRTSLNSFQLKGSGWYRDGYGSKSTDEASDKASKTEQKTGSKSSAA